MSDVQAKPDKRKPQGRSPSYPSVSLSVALEKAQAQFDAEGRYAAPLPSVFKAWGYGGKSSGARELRASLRYFGLITVEGEGDLAKIKLTEDALRVLMDKREDETEKRQIIRRLALNPTAHKKLWGKFPEGLKSDATVAHFLIFEEGYNQSAAEALIAEFRDTAAYAGLYEPDNVVDKTGEPDHSGESENLSPRVRVSDKIQWASMEIAGGATVLALSEDGQWVFTDQGAAAVPVSEVTVVEQAVVSSPKIPPPAPPHVLAALAAKATGEGDTAAKPGTRKAVFPVDEGDVTLIFPETLTADGLKELGLYLDIFLKKEAKKQGS